MRAAMRTRNALLALTGVLVAALGGAAVGQAAATKPDFTLGVNPVSQSVQRGQAATSTITATPTGGFTGSITLTATGTPSGATTSFTPPAISTSGTATMTVTTNAPAGTYQLTITGTSGKIS